MTFEEIFKQGYEDYLTLPKMERCGSNESSELYTNKWCVITGMSCVSPHPHRHYTFVEFTFWCGKNQDLFDRFISPLRTKLD